MKTLKTSELGNEMEEAVQALDDEPVVVEKDGCRVAVMLSMDQYQRLQHLQGAWLGSESQKAAAQATFLND